MIETQNPEIDINQLLSDIQKEVLRQRKLAPLHIQRKKPSKEKGYFHLRDFLFYHDREFVTNAYLSILQREPDHSGLNEYLDQLRRGVPKALIIAHLRYSDEGKQKGVKIKGLLPYVGLDFLHSIPIIGIFLSELHEMINLPIVFRKIRGMEAYVGKVESSGYKLFEELAAKLHKYEDLLRKDQKEVKELKKQISSLKRELKSHQQEIQKLMQKTPKSESE